MSIIDPDILQQVHEKGFHAHETYPGGRGGQTLIHRVAFAKRRNGQILEQQTITHTDPADPVLVIKRVLNQNGLKDGPVFIFQNINGEKSTKFEHYKNGEYSDDQPDHLFNISPETGKSSFDEQFTTAYERAKKNRDKIKAEQAMTGFFYEYKTDFYKTTSSSQAYSQISETKTILNLSGNAYKKPRAFTRGFIL